MAKAKELIDCPGCGTLLSPMLSECPDCATAIAKNKDLPWNKTKEEKKAPEKKQNGVRKEVRYSRGSIHCTNCDYQGKPTNETPGSILIEIILWLCFIVPGLIYSIWRLSSRKKVCPVCNWAHLVPLR